MRRSIAIALGSLLLALAAWSGPAEAAAPDVSKCTEITGGAASSYYIVDTSGDAVLHIEITTEEPLCGRILVHVIDGDTGTVTTYTYPGRYAVPCATGAANCVAIEVNYGPASSAPSDALVYVESVRGQTVQDRGPSTEGTTAPFPLCDPTIDPDVHGGNTSDPDIPNCEPPGGDYFQ